MVELRSERVLVLRSLLGLTQIELANLAGITQSQISYAENKSRPVNKEIFLRIAEATGTPLSFFGVDVELPTKDTLHFRKSATAGVKATNQIVTMYGEAERISVRLMKDLVMREPDLPFATGAVGRQRIEELAAELRQALKLSENEPVRNLIRAGERAGIAFSPLVDGALSGPRAHDGISRWSSRNGYAMVGYIPATGGDRQRLTVAHELGHLVLHTHRVDVDHKQREMEAMAFAGALLYPLEAARRDLSESLNVNGYVRLKAQWGISVQAIVRRAYDLDLISKRRYESLNVQISAKGWRRSEPVEVGIERPALLWRLLVKAFGPAPYLPAANELGTPLQFLRTWIPERDVPQRSRPKAALAPVVHLRPGGARG